MDETRRRHPTGRTSVNVSWQHCNDSVRGADGCGRLDNPEDGGCRVRSTMGDVSMRCHVGARGAGDAGLAVVAHRNPSAAGVPEDAGQVMTWGVDGDGARGAGRSRCEPRLPGDPDRDPDRDGRRP